MRRLLGREDTDRKSKKAKVSESGSKKAKSLPNVEFYNNQIPSKPDGDFIDEIHRTWWGDYDQLEAHHSYIQWLFPIYEGPGVNWRASALTKEESKRMRASEEIGERFVKSYQMMLDFYGMELDNLESGEGG